MYTEIGNSYGTMTVIEDMPSINPTGKKNIRVVKVHCSLCNTVTEKRLDNLKRPSTSGCSRECPAFKERITKHGLTNSKVYKSWDNMVTRCTRPSHKSYEHYDHLIIGPKIDPRWLNFENFIADMQIPENKVAKLSIDRLNNRKGYFKDNCRWATQKEQTLNQEKSIINRFTSNELKTIREFYELAVRFKVDGVQVFTTKTLEQIFTVSSPTVTKILNGTYEQLSKEKEMLYATP